MVEGFCRGALRDLPPGVQDDHAIAHRPDGAEVLAYGAPNVGLGDAEMQPGWWTD